MPSAQGFYSLIQLGSGSGRKEAINLGVCLFCPVLGYANYKSLSSLKRVAEYWSDVKDLTAFIAASLEEIDYFVQTIGIYESPAEIKNALLQASSGKLSFSPPMWVMMESHPNEILANLFSELVELPRKSNKVYDRRLPELDFHFKNNVRLADFVKYDQRISIPNYKQIVAHYRYTSEREYLVVGKRLSGQPGDMLEDLQKYNLRGHYLSKTRSAEGYERQLILVPYFINLKDREILEEEVLATTPEMSTRLIFPENVDEFIQREVAPAADRAHLSVSAG